MCTILLVEDDEDIRRALTDLLDAEGHLVHAEPNGREALVRLDAASEPLCLILLDLHMPVMDGWDFLVASRSRRGASENLCFLTGSCSPS